MSTTTTTTKKPQPELFTNIPLLALVASFTSPRFADIILLRSVSTYFLEAIENHHLARDLWANAAASFRYSTWNPEETTDIVGPDGLFVRLRPDFLASHHAHNLAVAIKILFGRNFSVTRTAACAEIEEREARERMTQPLKPFVLSLSGPVVETQFQQDASSSREVGSNALSGRQFISRVPVSRRRMIWLLDVMMEKSGGGGANFFLSFAVLLSEMAAAVMHAERHNAAESYNSWEVSRRAMPAPIPMHLLQECLAFALIAADSWVGVAWLLKHCDPPLRDALLMHYRRHNVPFGANAGDKYDLERDAHHGVADRLCTREWDSSSGISINGTDTLFNFKVPQSPLACPRGQPPRAVLACLTAPGRRMRAFDAVLDALAQQQQEKEEDKKEEQLICFDKETIIQGYESLRDRLWIPTVFFCVNDGAVDALRMCFKYVEMMDKKINKMSDEEPLLSKTLLTAFTGGGPDGGGNVYEQLLLQHAEKPQLTALIAPLCDFGVPLSEKAFELACAHKDDGGSVLRTLLFGLNKEQEDRVRAILLPTRGLSALQELVQKGFENRAHLLREKLVELGVDVASTSSSSGGGGSAAAASSGGGVSLSDANMNRQTTSEAYLASFGISK